MIRNHAIRRDDRPFHLTPQLHVIDFILQQQ